MPKHLLIVESPTKARTIQPFLGEGYMTTCSYGHIRDLPKKGIGVDVAHEFTPTYEVNPDKKKIAADLKRAAKGAEVWLASDEDREGEAIAWHICSVLGLDPKTTKRIVFHEITKTAILEAIKKPRVIDQKLVDSQQARRVLDRLVGYELSPILWKKVRTGLSAGRVQSVAVRLIVEREREIKAFSSEASIKISALFEAEGAELPAETDQKKTSPEEAREFLQDISSANFCVASIDKKPAKRSPSAPFTTSTLQQEASRCLGYSVRQTMILAQRLYEHGLITYMRTDSTNLSSLAIDAAKTYITQTFGDKYLETRQYKTKSRSAQEAHEAIRPTDFKRTSAGEDSQQKKLYELIWRRTLASQMASASTEKTDVIIDIDNRPEKFKANGEIVVFDGFLKAYGSTKQDKILPPLKKGQKLELTSALAQEVFSRGPARYTEASLVKKLEELGIGRPSTYAPTISTIQDRGYVEKADVDGDIRQAWQAVLEGGKLVEESVETRVGADKAKLLPTSVAEVVTDFLMKYFSSILDYDFTAKAEAEFDYIAEGKRAWQDAIGDFYKRFHPLIAKASTASRAEAAQARELGKDPATDLPVIVRFGRYGPVLQLGDTEDEEKKPKFAPLPKGVSMEDVTLDQALPMFALPRKVGQTADGQEILASIGRFGPYIQVGKKYVSLKEDDPMSISEIKARQLFEANQKQEAEKLVADWGKLKILRGPYGPYITDGKKNARVPKDTDPKTLNEKQAAELLAKAPAKKFRRRVRK